jgi:hypothetical protein
MTNYLFRNLAACGAVFLTACDAPFLPGQAKDIRLFKTGAE